MKKRNVKFWMAAWLALVLLGGLLLAGCAPEVRVGTLQTESQSVELGDAKSVRVQITMGAGDLEVTGGAEKLLEADFAYNVARLKPEVTYADGTLVVRQPDTSGFPNMRSVTNYRNEWDLRLNDGVPMSLKVDMGAGAANLHLAGLSLTGLDVNAGAGEYTIDLTGDWARDLDARIEAGAAEVTVRLPTDVGARVEVQSGPHTIRATGLTKAGDAYTNAAYGVSKVTLRVDLQVGVGQINLEVDGATAARQQQEHPAAAEAPPKLLNREIGQKLQAALEAAVASPDTKWPGAVLYVRAPGLGVWSGAAGLGEVATKTAMRPNDRFRAGSLPKPFISAVVLQLVEEGRFGLDDKIDKLLRGKVSDRFANTDRISVRMLLNHTSGLPEFYDAAGPKIIADPDKVWNVEEFLDLAATQQPFFAPGESQHYTNTNYLLLGLIIEEATGRTWREELRRRIFEPLGLKNTFLPAPEDKTVPGMHAHGYADFGSGPFDATELVTASVVGAAGGQSLVTNAEDLATFIDALLAGQLFQQRGTLEEMLAFLKVPAAEFPAGHPISTIATGYGLGMMRATYGGDVTGIGHTGDTDGGYHGFVFHFPKQKITVSGAVNAKDTLAGWIQLMPRVLEVLVPGYTMPEAPAPQQPGAAEALQGLVDDQVQKQDILGMIMAVRLADGTVVTRSSGYTDPAGQTPWTADTVSPIGSITKSFTGVVVMQLVQEGKLSLTDTIDKWFPDQPNGGKITVRMLLSHTSGLANYISADNSLEPKFARQYAPAELIAEANRLGPVDEPGTSLGHYSNTAYILLGMIVEKITGNTWKQEVRSRIIDPLGLKHTTFLSEPGVWEQAVVKGYFKGPDGAYHIFQGSPYPHASTSWAAGEIVSTPSDLMTFASGLFDGKLVSKETLARMATPLVWDPQNGVLWGLGGAALEDLPGGFGMEGGIPGYSAIYIGVRDTKLAAVALLNTQEGSTIPAAAAAMQYLVSLPEARAQPAPGAAQPTATPPDIANQAAEWLAREVKVAPKDLRLVKAEPVTWTDSCFGLGGPAESCLRADIPGWRITFEAAGKQYELRTDQSGSTFRLAPPWE